MSNKSESKADIAMPRKFRAQAIVAALNSKSGYGLLFLRLVTAWMLIAGTWPFVVQRKPVEDIVSYFVSLKIPFPALSAYVSIYAQFICGVLLALGLYTRLAAAVMIINFATAIIAAHLNDPITKSFPAWAILAASVVLLLHGKGRLWRRN
jgi:putative oxidoreductase